MLAITLGDPLSVTVEALIYEIPRLFAKGTVDQVPPNWGPMIIIGSLWHWRDQCRRLGITSDFVSEEPLFPEIKFFMTIKTQAELRKILPTGPQSSEKSDTPIIFFDIGPPELERPAEMLSALERGSLAVKALAALKNWYQNAGILQAQRLAVVTCPIDKFACHEAGFNYPGQTEFFEDLWGGDAVMTLAGPRLKVGLATNHHALANVPPLITEALLIRKVEQLAKTLRQVYGIKKPNIALCGLNPHAGDRGLFGREEIEIIKPAINRLQQQTHQFLVSGPFPADTVFYRAYHGHYDAVLAMYHDQGLGPLKTVHFDNAVNISGGLDHLRVSPDHGPAKDLFLNGEASRASFRAALTLAANYRHGSPS